MITLLCLNIEGGMHLERVLPFLKQHSADVVCLQEVFKEDMPKLAAAIGCEGHFVAMHTKSGVNEFSAEARGVQGLAYFTALEHDPITIKFYVGTGTAPEHLHPDDEDRMLAFTTVRKDGESFTIGTTHFTWTPDGEANDKQRVALAKLLSFAPEELVLCGDFNAPRGREIFTKLAEHYTDNLPADVESTLDPKLHRKPGLQLAVDSIFSTKHYRVSDVQVIDGVSDHKALIGTISRKE